MKKILCIFLLASLLLSACEEGTTQAPAEPSKNQESVQQVDSKGNPSGNFTVLDLKKKYGTEKNKAIMPMYNVEQDKEFIFTFKADLLEGSVDPHEIVSVHTDIKVEEQSEIFTIIGYDTYSVSIKPSAGVLPTEAIKLSSDSSWGSAPIYYIRLNYDLDSAEMTKLDKPIIIPFTVKSELPVPNLKREILPDGTFKLVWSKVEGAESYKVYNRSVITLLETTNLQVTGAEEGYAGSYPRLVKEIKETEVLDFMDSVMLPDPEITSYQNRMVAGEYYVTAIAGNKESNFSNGVSTFDISEQLPHELDPSLTLARFKTIADLPGTISVENINGSFVDKKVIYDTNIEIKEYGDTNVHFTIPSTAFKGYVMVESVNLEEIATLTSRQQKTETSGYVAPENTTDYVPSPDVPTVIGLTRSPDTSAEVPEAADETPDASENLVDTQKANTAEQVEAGNNETFTTPAVANEVKINADSALEEYLAAEMINAKEEISIKAFPEAQNFEVLIDAMQKVTYQNPLILGLKRYGYDYETLTLYVEYDFSEEEIRQRQTEIVAEAKKIVASTIQSNMTDDEKRLAIYDYLNDNTKYDDAALESAEANDFKEIDPKFNDSFNTYGIMVNKVGVCASYASVYKMLSDLSGLESVVVTGDLDGVPHAWNKVRIGNEWVHVDATNNETNSGIPYLLYNSNDSTATALNFTVGEEFWLDSEISQFDSKDNSMDYYVAKGLEVNSADELGTKIAELLKQGESIITLRMGAKITDDSMQEAIVEAFHEVDESKLENAMIRGLGTYITIEH